MGSKKFGAKNFGRKVAFLAFASTIPILSNQKDSKLDEFYSQESTKKALSDKETDFKEDVASRLQIPGEYGITNFQNYKELPEGKDIRKKITKSYRIQSPKTRFGKLLSI